MPEPARGGRAWALWLLGFVAGFVLASYLAVTVLAAHAQSPEVAQALAHASAEQGVSLGCLRTIAWRESRYLPGVDNFQGSGAAGLMQFMARTWRENAPRAGYDAWPGQRYDPWAAAHVAAWMLARPWTGALGHWGGVWGRTC